MSPMSSQVTRPRAMAVIAALVALASMRPAAQSAVTGDARFVVSLRGMVIGTATSSVRRTAQGWSIGGATQLDPPLGVTVRRLDVAYTDAWQPRDVTLDLATPAESVVVHGGGFGLATPARVDLVRDGRQVTFVTARVSPDALILPNYAYAAYEALALRLRDAAPGATWKVYVLPQRELRVRLDSVADERLRVAAATVATRHWRLTFVDPSGNTPADMWVEGGRLVRLDLPGADVSVVRTALVAR